MIGSLSPEVQSDWLRDDATYKYVYNNFITANFITVNKLIAKLDNAIFAPQ